MYKFKRALKSPEDQSVNALLESFYSGTGEVKKPIKFDGQIVGYNSKELNEEMIDAINSNSYFNGASASKIEKAIRGRKIIPLYLSESWFGDILDTFTFIWRAMDGAIIGFYDGKRIVVMIANLRTLFGSIPDSQVYGIITHELQHKFAGEKSGFHQDTLVKELLNKWYSNFIDIYFDGGLPEDARSKLMAFWTNIKQEYVNTIDKSIDKRFHGFQKLLKEISQKHEELSPKLLGLFKYVARAYNQEGSIGYVSPFMAGIRAYQKMGIMADTYIFQEFIIPSEVICVCSAANKNWGNTLLSKYL